MGDKPKWTDALATREEAAKFLGVVPRTVDRFAADGSLLKVHTGPSRSMIVRDSLTEHLARQNGLGHMLDGDVVVESIKVGATNEPGRYSSPTKAVHLMTLGKVRSEEAAKLDQWLSRNGFPGCLVHLLGDGSVAVMWAESLDYDGDVITKAIERAKWRA